MKSDRKDVAFGSDTDEGDEAIENDLPDYLKARKAEFEHRKAELGTAGFKLPPTYGDVDFSDDERLHAPAERPYFRDCKPPAPHKDINLSYSAGVIPAPIAKWLKPYQVEGAAFLHELFVYQKGGLLGDDMGLGKTIQVIAALTAAFGKTGDERDDKRMRKKRRTVNTSWYPRVLVICPGSLMINWKSELDRWGWWNIYMYHGSRDSREAALRAAEKGRLEIMITTYQTYRTYAAEVNSIPWDCCVADECHIIKERKSDTTKAMLEVNALCRIGLSGTAIQNKYEELWTLLNWTNPGRFGPLATWKSAVSEPLKLGQAHDATSAQLSRARKTAKKLVNNLLPQFFLRRMKTLIAHQLPKKSDRVVFCPLTERQKEAYENFLDSDMMELIKTSTEMCECGSGLKRGWCCQKFLSGTNDKWQTFVFPSMAILRNLSNHLGLLIPSGSDHDKLTKELDYLKLALPDAWQELYAERENVVTLSNYEFCGKWRILNKLLNFWHANGDKVLVFSHSVRLLKLLQMMFQKTSYNVSYLDGSMKYEDRTKAVDDFNSDPDQFVFLISTRAGGVGLNITSANKVVVVDPNWNPSYDLQAQDRAYRIGQTRDVEVFRLVSSGTIEEIVYARQIYKQQQANIGYTASLERRYFKGVQENKDKKGEIFGLQNLFRYQGDNIVLRDIVNKTNVAESKAGVSVVGLDMESQDDDGDNDGDDFMQNIDDKEDAVMSQLAALVAAGDNEGNPTDDEKRRKKHKTDPIQGILANAGVVYTHENSEVIGSSKVETRLSKRAEEAGTDLDEAVFASQNGGPEPLSDDDAVAEVSMDEGFDDGAEMERRRPPRRDVAYRYNPAEDVRQRQLCSMAKAYGVDDPVEFALLLENWTPAQRQRALDRFYDKLRRGELEL